MKGSYSVFVKNNFIQYQFEIKRNITIIKGDSATGKTTLIDMIREYYDNGADSGITLQCQKECVVLDGRQWRLLLENTHDSIVFIDEGNWFVTTDEFASVLKKSDNYFVIVTRESLPNLPYSVEEIYGIKKSGKYGNLKQTYQGFYRIYGNVNQAISIVPDIVIVEDSNSGYEFFKKVSDNREWHVISANGKSNIFKLLKEYKDYRVLVIADGAAFGSEMNRVMSKLDNSDRISLCLPESFEWLILKSDLFKEHSIKEILNQPYDYIESHKYMSWERFFTDLLIDKTQDTYLKYSKTKLNDAYKNLKIQETILNELTNIVL